MVRRIHITSLGCPKNFVDSEVILGLLQKDGWQVVEEPEEAEVLLVNTCGFIQPAVEESVEVILELAGLKKDGTKRKLVVTGCMVQRYREKLLEEIPEIDLLVGTEGVKEIHTYLAGLAGRKSPELFLPERFLMDAALPRTLATPSYRAWMKITEGCNNRCSYCMIPSIRGDLRSRSIKDLCAEAVQLERKGVKELSLIAQDLTAYGTETGSGSQLVPLLEKILASCTIPWLRLLYLYPTGITDELLELMAQNSRVVPYLDIPFQHVSTPVLHRMNRPYTTELLEDLVGRIRKILPEVALRTTFLLGFPGETEKDVELVAAFLKKTHIDHVGVFAYSNEEGSPSEFYANQLSEEEKQQRVAYIHGLQAEFSAEILQRYRGKVEQVLVEGVSQETDLLLEGRTRFQAPDIDGCVLINDGQANAGDLVEVKISETQTYDLIGAIV
ncbi:MAG: 30S ribosomal protein S12 methylthiotransferase RimO [Desulfocapsaceae bacterium]|nr:30S ribosomal protein S12 methylthiotransferase RimO [Desulfocapsaceae bacterium]